MALYYNRRGVVLGLLLADPVIENTRRWATSITRGMSGQERRVSYINKPVRSIRERLMAYESAADLREALHLMPMAPVMVPNWSDVLEIQSPVSIGDVAITVIDNDLEHRSFEVGEYMMLISRDGTASHYGIIESIVSNVITINKQATSDFSLGAFVVPGLVCEIGAPTFREQVRGKYIELEFEATERREQVRDPVVSLSTTALTFTMVGGGSDPAPQAFTLSNVGLSTSTMHCFIDPASPVQVMNPSTGVTYAVGQPIEASVPYGTPAAITVGIDGTGLVTGTYTYGIKVDTRNPFEYGTVSAVVVVS